MTNICTGLTETLRRWSIKLDKMTTFSIPPRKTTSENARPQAASSRRDLGHRPRVGSTDCGTCQRREPDWPLLSVLWGERKVRVPAVERPESWPALSRGLREQPRFFRMESVGSRAKSERP